MKEKVFTPVQPGNLIPLYGFTWRVVSCDSTTMVLRVDGVTKAGKNMGYVVHVKNPNELNEKDKTT